MKVARALGLKLHFDSVAWRRPLPAVRTQSARSS